MVSLDNKRGFKSRGERLIGEFLDSQSIKYFYESPIVLMDGGKLRIWYPDFRLVEYQLIIEFLGMNNNPDYGKTTDRKKRAFEENYIDAVFLTDNSLQGDWQASLVKDIERIAKARYENAKRILEKM